MNAVGRIGSYISRSVYTVSAPFHPFGGAVDIIVVEQQDGSFKSSPWYVRFGKFQGVLKAREKVVSISVNGVEADFNMFLDHKGEAYFLRDVDFGEVDGGSALCSPSSSSEDADEQSRERERKPGLKSKSCNYDAYESTSLTKIEVSNGKVLARTNSRRSRIMGLVFGKKPPAKIENEAEGEGESDSNVNRSESLERAEIAADLLEVKWSTNLASPRCKKESGSGACSQQSLDSKDSVGTRLKHECSDDRMDGSDDSILRSGETEQVCAETAQTTGLVWEVNSEAETGFSGKGPLSVGDASDNQDSVHEKATVSPHSFGINIVSECSDDTTDSSDDIILCSGGTEQATGLASKVNSEAETGFSGKEPLSIEDASESRDASGSLCNRDAHAKATVSPHSSRNYFVSECSDGTTDGSDDIILCSGGTEQVYVETEQTTGLVCEVNSESGTGFSGKKPFLSIGDASESQDASAFPCDKNAHENATVSLHSLGNNFVSECREDTTDGSDDIILCSGGTEQVYVETVQTSGLVCEVNSVAETGFSGKEPLSIEDASESQDASHENATASPHSTGNNFVSECSDDTTDGLNDIILHSGGTEQVYVETVQTTGLVCQVNCEAETGFTGKQPLSIGDASESQDALGFPCDKNAHENATISPRSLGNNFVSETTVTLQPVYGCVGGIESQSIMTISTVTSQALPEKTGPGEDEQTKYDPQMKSLGSPIHVLTSEISEEEHLLFGDFDDLKFTSVGDKEEPVSPKSDMKEGDPQLLNIELEEKFTGKLKSVSSQINIPATRDQSDADLRIARSLPIMSSNKLNCSFGVNDSESLSTNHITRNEKETNNQQSHSGQTAEDASTATDPSIGNTTSNIGTDGEKDMSKSKVNNKKKTRSICPTTKQLASLNLKGGSNTIIFTFSTPMLGKQQVDARIYLWKWDTRVVISDVDGTITRSDLLGQVMPWVGVDWSHIGVTHLFSAIKENGYQMLFLSARAISQAYLTRQFLFNLKQDGKVLPEGPVVISPDGLFPSLYREVVRRAPHEFKIACLEEIKALFPADRNPFYAGFGNRDTDEISYLKVGIPKGKIFIINPKGEVVVNRRVDKKSYTSLHTLVQDMFPPTSSSEQEDFNCWNYWKLPNAYEL